MVRSDLRASHGSTGSINTAQVTGAARDALSDSTGASARWVSGASTGPASGGQCVASFRTAQLAWVVSPSQRPPAMQVLL